MYAEKQHHLSLNTLSNNRFVRTRATGIVGRAESDLSKFPPKEAVGVISAKFPISLAYEDTLIGREITPRPFLLRNLEFDGALPSI